MATNSLPKARRIRKRADFLKIARSGRKVHGRHFLVQMADGSGRVGITVSRRVGGAVVRNRVKRRIREVLRHHFRLSHLDIVVVAKKTAANLDFVEVERDLKPALSRL